MEYVQSDRGHDRTLVQSFLCLHFDLPISTICIFCGKKITLPCESMHLPMRSIEKESRLVTTLILRQSTQNQKVPFFFGNEYYPCGIFCLCGLDDIPGKCLININLFYFARFRTSLV